MQTFFSADTHFQHTDIIKHAKRPFESIEDMNETLISNWNSKVGINDEVIFLGDFAWKNVNYFISRLNGNITFVTGNHDKFKINNLELDINGEIIYCVHNPDEAQDHNITLHGHVHNLWKYKKIKNKIFINVGTDVWGYYPVSLRQIRQCIEENDRQTFK